MMAGEPGTPNDDNPEDSSEALPSKDLDARLTSPYEDADPAETTDPSLFSIQADTRLDINIWQLKMVAAITVPFALVWHFGELSNGVAGGIGVGLLVSILVTGVMLGIRYYRGR